MHKFNMSFVFHFYILGLTSWKWINPWTERLGIWEPFKMKLIRGLQSWTLGGRNGARAIQFVYSFLGGKGLGIQQGITVWGWFAQIKERAPISSSVWEQWCRFIYFMLLWVWTMTSVYLFYVALSFQLGLLWLLGTCLHYQPMIMTIISKISHWVNSYWLSHFVSHEVHMWTSPKNGWENDMNSYMPGNK